MLNFTSAERGRSKSSHKSWNGSNTHFARLQPLPSINFNFIHCLRHLIGKIIKPLRSNATYKPFISSLLSHHRVKFIKIAIRFWKKYWKNWLTHFYHICVEPFSRIYSIIQNVALNPGHSVQTWCLRRMAMVFEAFARPTDFMSFPVVRAGICGWRTIVGRVIGGHGFGVWYLNIWFWLEESGMRRLSVRWRMSIAQ